MRLQFDFMLLGALVVVTILGAADSFVTNADSAGEDSQPLVTGDSNFAYAGAGVENVYYPQTTGDQFVSESASADVLGTTSLWPGEGANQWKTTDQATGNPSQQVGFFDAIRSLTNIFTGLVGRASIPETPTPIDSGYYYQHSEEDTTDEDFYDDRVIAPVTDVPIAVRLARVKQLVKTRLAPRSSPNIYDGYPQYPPAAVMEDPREAPASDHQDVILTPAEHVSENFGCNSRICLWKK